MASPTDVVACAAEPRTAAPAAAAPDNTRLILARDRRARRGAWWALLVLANRSTRPGPDFLTEFVLYALVGDEPDDRLVALVFVLARNIVKLVVEQRRRAAVRALPRQARGGAARR